MQQDAEIQYLILKFSICVIYCIILLTILNG
jgi:hypothetical protein